MRTLFVEGDDMTQVGVKTAVDICNMAMDHLNQKANISNIENPVTDNEILFARHYWAVLEFVLRNYVWNFAKGRKVIMRDPLATPEFDYTDAYKLPNDFLRLISYGNHENLIGLDFDIVGDHLLLNNDNSPDVRLRYIKRIADVKQFDSGFVHLFSLYLALNIAFKLTAKQTLIDRLAKRIELFEAKIVSIDGQEKPPVRIQRSKYNRARNGVGTYSASKYLVFKD